jgi:mannose-6-phosphate isomerase-like protein (cupin superfamily)
MMSKTEIDPLDALIAAPEHHRLLLENDKVRVVETLIPAGERTAIHTHQWEGVLHVRSWSDFVRRDDHDNVLVDTRTNEALRNPAEVIWGPALPPHSLENVGNQTLRIIAVELKE